MGSALEFAEVRSFSARGGDIAGLLHWLRPDALIVDSDAGAAEAAAFALEHDLPVLLHVSMRDRELRLFRGGGGRSSAMAKGRRRRRSGTWSPARSLREGGR